MNVWKQGGLGSGGWEGGGGFPQKNRTDVDIIWHVSKYGVFCGGGGVQSGKMLLMLSGRLEGYIYIYIIKPGKEGETRGCRERQRRRRNKGLENKGRDRGKEKGRGKGREEGEQGIG